MASHEVTGAGGSSHPEWCCETYAGSWDNHHAECIALQIPKWEKKAWKKGAIVKHMGNLYLMHGNGHTGDKITWGEAHARFRPKTAEDANWDD